MEEQNVLGSAVSPIAGYTQKAMDMAVEFAPTVLLALITLIVGFWIIGKIVNLARTRISRSGMDETLASFLSSLISIALKVMLLLSVEGDYIP